MYLHVDLCSTKLNFFSPFLSTASTVVQPVGPVITQADVCRQPADRGPCDQQVS